LAEGRPVSLHRSAEISDCGTYRYELARWWTDRPDRQVLWVLLNPSTADERKDDATIRRCIAFSQSWGYDGLVLVNLFALRSTKPSALKAHPDPVGPSNDAMLDRWANDPAIDHVVCAWGAHGVLRNRGLIVRTRLARLRPLHAFGETLGGHPQHPLYIAGDAPLVLLEPGP
jgi:hypothetical protein